MIQRPLKTTCFNPQVENQPENEICRACDNFIVY
jgi:hypothetical protein